MTYVPGPVTIALKANLFRLGKQHLVSYHPPPAPIPEIDTLSRGTILMLNRAGIDTICLRPTFQEKCGHLKAKTFRGDGQPNTKVCGLEDSRILLVALQQEKLANK